MKEIGAQQVPHQSLSLFNLPVLIKLVPLPNSLKQTRKRVIIRNDDSNSEESDGHSSAQKKGVVKGTQGDIFLYSPW